MTTPDQTPDWADRKATVIVKAWFSSHQSINVFPFDKHLAQALRQARTEGEESMGERAAKRIAEAAQSKMYEDLDPPDNVDMLISEVRALKAGKGE